MLSSKNFLHTFTFFDSLGLHGGLRSPAESGWRPGQCRRCSGSRRLSTAKDCVPDSAHPEHLLIWRLAGNSRLGDPDFSSRNRRC
jgi:hypothetical protein